MKFTQDQKVIGLMVGRRDQQEWFYPYDFMPPRLSLDYIYCVGYEAPRKLRGLRQKYPDMIESQPGGKFMKWRIRFETIDQWFSGLPKDLRYMFHRAGMTEEIKRRRDPRPGQSEAHAAAAERGNVAREAAHQETLL